MERLLHYVWKHKIFPLRSLKTTEGKEIEVINPGLHNTDAGPDFFNAKVKINGTLWVGNVEIHERSSDWFRHSHDKDSAYNNVILHVTSEADCDITDTEGKQIPQVVLPVPDYVEHNFEELLHSDSLPRCRNIIGSLPGIMVHSWLSALQIERLQARTEQIMERRERCEKSWEDAFFITMARNFGFGINGDAFEQWAYSIPLSATGKHRDNLFQVEAIFFGQAGLLEDEMIPQRYQAEASTDKYLLRLRSEYNYLKQKFSLTPMNTKMWRFLRLRPQNFPHIRLAQLAMLYHENRLNLSRLIYAEGKAQICDLLSARVSEYWRTHYSFASTTSPEADKRLSDSSLSLLLINTAAPILFAYGKYKNDDRLCERAARLLEEIKAEDNRITRSWHNAGVRCESAADSQAIIQLHTFYCEPHNCLRCRFGYEFIRHTPGMLKEEE